MKHVPYDPTGPAHELRGLSLIVVGAISLLALIILAR